ncbi:MAG: hypothetical protein FJ297_19305, partial [Planctomycetes bacterium]|nr:hypothetical protein [Planctomycetota bacterium]
MAIRGGALRRGVDAFVRRSFVSSAWRSARARRHKRRTVRSLALEPFEDRRMLSAAPIGRDDLAYHTPIDTPLVVAAPQGVLSNDWDPENTALQATLVDSPASGTLSQFNAATGAFTYTPQTAFEGIDTFTYRASDGTDQSPLVTVQIAVGGTLTGRLALEDQNRAGMPLTGGLIFSEGLTPAVGLVYHSLTIPQPIVALETMVPASESVPDEIRAQWTVNGVAGSVYSYDATGLQPGQPFRIALQADATSLATGRYAYQVTLTSVHGVTEFTRTITGHVEIVNRSSSTHAFGRGWNWQGLETLTLQTGGVLWVRDMGESYWFAEKTGGGYERAIGDESYASLTADAGGTYTLTDKHGFKRTFSSAGQLVESRDRWGSVTTYAYASGLLSQITDPYGRTTSLGYTSGRLSSVTDFAGRAANLSYDTDGRLVEILQPDPDGAGPQTRPATSFGYSASHLLNQRTDPIGRTTQFTFGSNGRLTQVTYPGGATESFIPSQTVGLPTGSNGNTPATTPVWSQQTDPRGKTWRSQTDRFGRTTATRDPLNYETTIERDLEGNEVRVTRPDPDGAGPLGILVDVAGYNSLGDVVHQRYADGGTITATYTTDFHLPASVTDELGQVSSFTYDSVGNAVSATDAAGQTSTMTYNARGFLLTKTSPDPDGVGPLSPITTTLAYDSLDRMTSVTFGDNSTQQFAYDSADNRVSVTDELGHATLYTFDALDRLTRVVDREGAATDRVLDAAGQLVQTIDALGGVTDYEYDSRGRLTRVRQPDPDGAGPLDRPESQWAYDAAGNVASEGSPIWQIGYGLTHDYDDAGRRTATHRVTAGTNEYYTYDALGRVLSATDAQGRVTTYQYNARGRTTRIELNDPDGSGPQHGPTHL